jgi:hypothetical protein
VNIERAARTLHANTADTTTDWEDLTWLEKQAWLSKAQLILNAAMKDD